MLQQTTVSTVAPRFAAFVDKWPTLDALAAAPVEDILAEWAGLGYYARARNLHAAAREAAARGGLPDTERELRSLPGVGQYTAAAIAAIAFGRRAIVLDGNIERIIARIFRVAEALPGARDTLREHAESIWPRARSGDFAQGLMDIGAAICRPKKPSCLLCPIANDCAARRAGDAEAYPRKAPRPARPTRYGAAFILSRGAKVLTERRPEEGLLGGMACLPGSNWTLRAARRPLDAAPAAVEWSRVGVAKHGFTHFALELEVYVGAAAKGFRKGAHQLWIAPDKAGFPTAFRKAIDLWRASPSADANA